MCEAEATRWIFYRLDCLGDRLNPMMPRSAGDRVVHVRHISRTSGSPFSPGQSGAEFQPAFEPLARERVVEKNVPDAFINTGLERWLRVRGIDSVAIVGLSTNNSVEASARTAGNLGFKTYVVADATFAFAKTDFNGIARTEVEVHAMSLANLYGEYANVVTTPQLIAMRSRSSPDEPGILASAQD